MSLKISDKSCDTMHGNHRFALFLNVFVLKHPFFFPLSPPGISLKFVLWVQTHYFTLKDDLGCFFHLNPVWNNLS